MLPESIIDVIIVSSVFGVPVGTVAVKSNVAVSCPVAVIGSTTIVGSIGPIRGSVLKASTGVSIVCSVVVTSPDQTVIIFQSV